MAGIPGKGGVKGKSGPPGNTNAFKHGWRLFRSSRAVRMDHRTIEPAIRGLLHRCNRCPGDNDL